MEMLIKKMTIFVGKERPTRLSPKYSFKMYAQDDRKNSIQSPSVLQRQTQGFIKDEGVKERDTKGDPNEG